MQWVKYNRSTSKVQVPRPVITIQDIYNAYTLMYIWYFIDDPCIRFDCCWIIEEIKDRILDELENVCIREFRHIELECDIYSIRNGFVKDVVKRCGINRMSIDRFADTLKVLGTQLRHVYGSENRDKKYNTNWMNLLYFQQKYHTQLNLQNIGLIFKVLPWNNEYAGEGWSNTAIAVHELAIADPTNFFHQFDRVIDLVHNNGTVLQKLNIKNKQKFKRALTIKNRTAHPITMLPECSSIVRSIYCKARRNNLFWFHEKQIISYL